VLPECLPGHPRVLPECSPSAPECFRVQELSTEPPERKSSLRSHRLHIRMLYHDEADRNM
jgi:hypothetical protein